MPDKRRGSLFGFALTKTSALLLFIGFVFVIIICLYGFYQVVSIYNATSQIPVVMLIGFFILFVIGVYIVYKSLSYKK